MSLLTKDKITEIFYPTDEFCKDYSSHIQEHKSRALKMGLNPNSA